MNKPLTVEIHGTGTHNRGAELMAIAISDKLRARFPGVRIVVPVEFGPYELRAAHRFWTTLESRNRYQRKYLQISSRFPNSIDRLFTSVEAKIHALSCGRGSVLSHGGILHPKEIDLVIDASGFAFSDQWGAGRAQTLLRKMEFSRRGKPLILMPQAFGPFRNPSVAISTRKLIERASLIYPRDSSSYSSLCEVVGTIDKVVQTPDFTLSVEPLESTGLGLPSKYSCIVPNVRMMDKTDYSEDYLCFLEHSIACLERNDLKPIFLLHDANEDQRVLNLLRERNIRIPCYTHPDPRVLKGILSNADLVLASRFHALVSALSQGVPCIGVGWSHKYPELFSDFGCKELLLTDLSRLDILEAKIKALDNKEQRDAISATLVAATGELKSKVSEMWESVFHCIESAKLHN
ncbi:polysaccharide pyruvyl transferase family protein [Planctomycetaceae bacterium SH139]